MSSKYRKSEKSFSNVRNADRRFEKEQNKKNNIKRGNR